MTGRQTRHKRDYTVYASGLVAALWVVLAWGNPDSTYHAAPPLIAVAFPLAHRLKMGPLPWPSAIGAGFGGVLNVLVVTGLLWWLGKLEGPSLLSVGGPPLEAVVFGVVGGAVGVFVARWPHRRAT